MEANGNEDTSSNGGCHQYIEIEEPKWERVLWKQQPYPDSYIGPDFFRVKKKREIYFISIRVIQVHNP